ncbi:hypothetical protein LZ480_11450 [Solibacillus sp. MA9]|uniref:Uncharacterized protein n=1 Tax=Solibacillus palustris TaxID=2908203 RepID=A0ABS9UEW6_9BACL|nr:hypothetical protein [Solibacillus sp. MA9]MCH7322508.1 hypothetical protein [Solibacillus sp. MA9]
MQKLTKHYADYLIMIVELIKGEIDFEGYFKKRGINQKVILNEVKFILNNPIMFNLFLSKISIGVRCMAMKAIFDLNNRQIVDLSYSLSQTYNSKTTIGDFINDYLDESISSNLNKKRTYNAELYYDLSIILDIPFRYLIDPVVLYKMTGSFDEYDREKIKLYKFKDLVVELLMISKNLTGNERKISGIKIKKEDFFEFGEDLKTRIDIREKHFTIEIHIENESDIEYSKILKLKKLLKVHCKVYIRDGFLRENKKLVFLVILDDSINPDISYLRNELLFENLLLMKDTLKEYNNSLFNKKPF